MSKRQFTLNWPKNRRIYSNSLTVVNYQRLPRWRSGKEPACRCRGHKRQGMIPGLGRSSRVGNGNPLQYSHLQNSTDRGAWCSVVPGLANLDATEHAHIYAKKIRVFSVSIPWNKGQARCNGSSKDTNDLPEEFTFLKGPYLTPGLPRWR